FLGLISAIFVITRLLESWRVAPHAANRVSLLSAKLSYPAANAEAIVVLCLAGLGLIATIRALHGAIREIIGARRFRRAIAASQSIELGDALVIHDQSPRAFCAGLLRPRVYVSSGAVALLDQRALGAVLAHERHHARSRDPLRLAVSRVLAHALFFVPGLRELGRRRRLLAELSADESAMNLDSGSRSDLARAMLAFSDAGAGTEAV